MTELIWIRKIRNVESQIVESKLRDFLREWLNSFE